MWIFYVIITCVLLLGVKPWVLTTPDTVIRYTADESVTVICHADVALTACEIRTQYDIGNQEAVINLTSGKESLPYNSQYYNATYYGTGLAEGQCGVLFRQVKEALGSRVLICRARAISGGWKEKEVVLLRDDVGEFQLTVHQPRALALKGTDVSLLFTTAEPMTVCFVWIPGESKWLTFNKGKASPVLSRYKYHGTGLDQGQCGVTITDVTDKDSGIVWVGAALSGAKTLYMPSILIVAVAPSEPELVLTSGTTYKDGDTIKATCTVSGSVPSANITWYLGDKLVSSDLENDLPDLDWNWPWNKQTYKQTLVQKIFADDNGKELICRIKHLAFKGYRDAKQTISVTSKTMECGMKGISLPSLVAGGSDATVGEYPWHAGIFKKKMNSYSQHCGGTLITKNIVLTAAHCFWDGYKRRVMKPTMFKVGVGKVKRSWDAQEPGAQKVGIKEIVIRPRYTTNIASQMHDIAIVVLETSVNLTDTVNVACVDWTNEYEEAQLSHGRSGLVTGWGLREDGEFSELLQSVSLPWVSEETCWGSIPNNTKRYYTVDKFCAGYVGKGVSVCPADSGGGLVFQNVATRQHFIRGIVSVSFAPSSHNRTTDGCYAQHYSGFTRVSFYLDWIETYRNTTP